MEKARIDKVSMNFKLPSAYAEDKNQKMAEL